MRTILRKELLELWRDGRFKYSAVLLCILLIFATIIGVKQYQKVNTEYKQAKVAERHIWESQGEKNPHSAAHYGTYAFKPKFALSLFDNGVNSYTGNSIFLEAHKRNEAAYSDASDQTGVSRFGNLSLNFILLYLVPLIILLFGYNSISRECEMDTLKLLKSQGVKPLSLIGGKWLSVFLPIALITFILFLLVGVVLASTKDFDYFCWNSLLVLLSSYLLYYAIITSIVILISLWSKSSGISLVFNLFVWILFGFISPKIATNFANNSHPYPTKQQFYDAIKKDKENGLDGHNPWNKEAKLLKENTLKKYGVDSVGQLPFNYDAFRMQKGEEHETMVYQKNYLKLKKVFERQNHTYQTMAIVSPFIPLRLLSMDVANTSYISHWNFSDAAENYRIEKQRFLNGDLMNNSKTGDWNYKMKADGFKQLPQFSYNPPMLKEILKVNTSNFLILLGWLILPFCLLLFSSKKL